MKKLQTTQEIEQKCAKELEMVLKRSNCSFRTMIVFENSWRGKLAMLISKGVVGAQNQVVATSTQK